MQPWRIVRALVDLLRTIQPLGGLNMRRTLTVLSIGIVALVGLAISLGGGISTAQQKETTLLSHDVYFTLKDNSPEAKKKLVHACKKKPSGHEGEVFFAAGVRADEF